MVTYVIGFLIANKKKEEEGVSTRTVIEGCSPDLGEMRKCLNLTCTDEGMKNIW